MSESKTSETEGKEPMDVEAGRRDSEAFRAITAQMMNDPEALALMQSKLAGMVGNISGYYDSLPKSVKRRVKALKKLQVDYLKMEAKFHQEMHAIECKYNNLYQTVLAKRAEIVNALHEPTEEECDFPSDSEEEEDEDDEDEEGAKEKKLSKEMEEKMKTDEVDDTKGIPEFWLTIFKSVEVIAENVQECDEPILKHLTDIKVKMNENPMSFTLEFHFSPNEFFTDRVLIKTYELKCVPDETDPFSFEGPEIAKAEGCKINWIKGKNVTLKTVLKKQKHKAKGSIRTVPKQVPSDSFFNFFSPPEIPENEEDIDEATQDILSADFEIGEIIRHRLIPRAVLYFTGEALMEEDYEDEEEDEDDEFESDDDSSNDSAPDAGAGESEKKPRKKRGQSGNENPQECKQQ